MTKEQVKEYIIEYCQNDEIFNYNEIIDFVAKHNLWDNIMERPKNKRPIFFTNDKKYSVIKCSKEKYNAISQPSIMETYALFDNFIVSTKFNNCDDPRIKNFIIIDNEIIIIDEEIIIDNPSIYQIFEKRKLDIKYLIYIDDVFLYAYKDYFIYDFYRNNIKIKTNSVIKPTDFCCGKCSIFVHGGKIYFINDKHIYNLTLKETLEIIDKHFSNYSRISTDKMLKYIKETQNAKPLIYEIVD